MRLGCHFWTADGTKGTERSKRLTIVPPSLISPTQVDVAHCPSLKADMSHRLPKPKKVLRLSTPPFLFGSPPGSRHIHLSEWLRADGPVLTRTARRSP